jgi:signal peptidase I
LVAVLLALFARTWVVQIFRIPSSSMEPGLRAGDHVVVNKFIYGPVRWPWERSLLPLRAPRRGDVVVFKFPRGPDRRFVKRCMGLPKDRIEIIDKVLLADDEPLAESGYVWHQDSRVYTRSLMLDDGYRKRDNFGPVIVPAGQFFLLGDNRDESYDSRFWGLVPGAYFRGRAVAVLWSWPAESAGENAFSDWAPRLVR